MTVELKMENKDDLIKEEYTLGVNTNVRSIHALSSDKILYSCANNVVIWQRYDRSQITVHRCQPQERIKMTVLCPSRKLLGIVIAGSDGHCIVIYDITNGGNGNGTHRRKKLLRLNSPNNDSTSCVDNILGVSFSKDGKECLVLGDKPSYLLSLWNIEKVPKVLNSIRLATPSGKQIRRADMCPTDNRLICVSGNGIIKFFRITADSYIFRPVTVQLKREQQNYVYHCWLSSGAIVVLMTDTNELIAIKNFEAKAQIIIPADKWDDSITAVDPVGKSLLIGGNRGSIRMYRVNCENEQLSFKMIKEMSMDEEVEILAFDQHEPSNLAICLLDSGRICNVALSNFDQSEVIISDDSITGDGGDTEIVPSFHTCTTVKGGGEKHILCMDICTWKTILATGGRDKILRIWDFKKKQFELIHDCKDDIVSISLHPSSIQILLCTKTYVEVSEIRRSALSSKWRKDIATNGSSCFSNGGHYFALSIGEFVQIYNTFNHEIICTLRGHSAPVQSVCWKGDDLNVATIGKDGAVCIWNTYSGDRLFRHASTTQTYVDGFFTKDFRTVVINTKAGVEVLDIQSNSYVPGYEIPPGSRVLAIALNVIVVSLSGSTANCSGEIWVRNIFHQSGKTILHFAPRLSPHSQAISCSRISSDHAYMFTASTDGSLCISELNQRLFPQREFKFNEDVGCITLNDFLMSMDDLEEKDRYIASLREIMNRTKDEQNKEFQNIEGLHAKAMIELKKEMDSEDKRLMAQIHAEKTKLSNQLEELRSDHCGEQERMTVELKSTTEHMKAELTAKKLEAEGTEKSRKRELVALQTEIELLEKNHILEVKTFKDLYESKIRDSTREAERIKKDTEAAVAKYADEENLIQDQADKELINEQQAHEDAAFQEMIVLTRLKEENNILNKKYESLAKDSEEHNESILSLQEKQTELDTEIKKQQKEKIRISMAIAHEENMIWKLEREIRALSETTHQMERSKIAQSEIIKETKVDLATKQKEIGRLHKKNEDLNYKLRSESKHHVTITLKMQQEQQKLKAIRSEYEKKALKINDLAAEVATLESDVSKVHGLAENTSELKRYLLEMSRKHFVSKTKISSKETKSSCKFDISGECRALEKRIKTAKEISKRKAQLNTQNITKLNGEANILQKQLNEVDREIVWMKEKQSNVFSMKK